jgi:hypothetical protein
VLLLVSALVAADAFMGLPLTLGVIQIIAGEDGFNFFFTIILWFGLASMLLSWLFNTINRS